MKNNGLSKIQKLLVLLSLILLVIVLFVPLWQIDLWAPQYPEGLVLLMYPNQLAGDVEIINGLNHYIGMRELHTADFIEFTVLPYIIGFFAVFSLIVLLVNKRGLLAVLFWSFAIFGVISMLDFYRWEYNYGHNLDPSAAIKIPGMSYTPPLIGFKQLLNFDVLSRPHIGGVLFFGTGAILMVAFLLPKIKFRKGAARPAKKVLVPAAALFFGLVLSGCNNGPQAIKIGQDVCSFCKMTITADNFGGEIITQKGKVYKFDDPHCLAAFRKEKTDSSAIRDIYLVGYNAPHDFIRAEEAVLIFNEDFRSPMGGNVAAFNSDDDIIKSGLDRPGERITVQNLYNIAP